ncbi:MAG: hypothetical protein H8E36_01680 [Rhodospirillaceae bacterium]|nr:hypothetical protein [Rhodospirillaceae bacterium]
MLVDDEATIGSIRLHGCHRLGSLPMERGAVLLDAQTCAVEGNAKIIFGNQDGAAAVAIQEEGKNGIIVLDITFLSQVAPVENRNVILKWMIE